LHISILSSAGQTLFLCATFFRTAGRLEWWTTYLLCADDAGVVSKEKIRAVYDGSIFFLIADENERRWSAKKATYGDSKLE
jgi:hypothetical protein